MDLDIKQLAVAIRSIAEEKNLDEDVVKDILEQAIIAAYKKDFGDNDQEIKVIFNPNTGDIKIIVNKEVVDNVEDPAYQISLSDAKNIQKDIKSGEFVNVNENISRFGRVAAQTAKQVILQRLREAEKEILFSEFEHKLGTIANGNVSRIENGLVKIDLGRVQAIMPRSEQIQGEYLYPGQRVKVLVKSIEKDVRGPQLVVSRGSVEFIQKLFENEVPEMESKAVEIKAIAREAGVRTKIAVKSNVHGVDPVGTFVGGHGIRVNAVMSEIGEQEKIDILVFSDDIKELVQNALSPTQINKIEIDQKSKNIKVYVNDDQLSIAIGKGGQNVRLASKLVGYEMDIIDDTKNKATVPEPKPITPKLKKKSDLESSLLDAINEQDQ